MGITKLLKPCPFCGREIEKCSTEHEQGVCTRLQVFCFCGVDFDIRADETKYYADGTPWRFGDSAIDIWNRRKAEK